MGPAPGPPFWAAGAPALSEPGDFKETGVSWGGEGPVFLKTGGRSGLGYSGRPARPGLLDRADCWSGPWP
jgi:hypothetical protein